MKPPALLKCAPMRTPLRVSLVTLAFTICLAPMLAAQDDRPQEGRWSCFTAYDAGPTIYVTPVWDETALISEVQNGYAQHLLTEYGFTGQVFCSRATMDGSTTAQLTTDNASRNRAWEADGKRIVDTGWRFSPASASLPHLCAGYAQVGDAGTVQEYQFVNKVLRIPAATQSKLTLAWVDYLNELHPGWYYVDAGCMLLPADPVEQQVRIDAQVEMRAARNPEVVRLDWEWQEPSAADAAAAAAVDDQPAYYCEKLRADSKVWYVTPVHPLEPGGTREDYTWAWDVYAINTFQLNGYLGGCEIGTMKQAVLARATRMQTIQGIAGAEIHEVDWKYARPDE